VVGLEDAVLVWSEFLKLLLEELCFLIGDGFLVEDEDVTDVVVVYLQTRLALIGGKPF